MTKFPKKPGVLYKHMCIAWVTCSVDCIVELERNDSLKPAVEVNAVHAKEIEDLQTQIERHIKVEHEEEDWKAHDCIHEFKIDHKDNTYWNKLIGMIGESEFRADFYLGRLRAAKHFI